VLSQTSPIPEPDPLVELFLHGPERGVPDVQVLWRADLPDTEPDRWAEIVMLCPPSSRECMPVQIDTFKKWLAGRKNADENESDVGLGVQKDELGQKLKTPVLLWRGDENKVIQDLSEIKPGQTLVLSTSAEGWNELGHVPEGWAIDVGDEAAFDVRNTVSLRLHSKLIERWPKTPVLEEIRKYAGEPNDDRAEMEGLLRTYYAELKSLSSDEWPAPFLKRLQEKKLSRRDLSGYPTQEISYVLRARKSEQSTQREEPVRLDEHLQAVAQAGGELAGENISPALRTAVQTAGRFHDYGKTDMRFQAWLRGGDLMAARYAPQPIAKSGNAPVRRQQTAGLPSGFRHELLSLLFAEKSSDVNGEMRDLILHLIASHHGRCRPFAPVVLDAGAECVSYNGLSVCAQERADNAPHRLSGGVSDRFWSLTRQYGWWGLAYLEALLRLADWRASEAANTEVSHE
jgi:CRISPR-associated endonuclease/helicase Cas3